MLIKTFPVILIALFVTACAASFAPTYKEPPCGYRGHSCGNGSCCDEGYDCGGTLEFQGCPKDFCCANGGQLQIMTRPEVSRGK